MPNIPCKIRSLCLDPADPIGNYSSEQPDIPLPFVWGSWINPPGFDFNGGPPGNFYHCDPIIGPHACACDGEKDAELCIGMTAKLCLTDKGIVVQDQKTSRTFGDACCKDAPTTPGCPGAGGTGGGGGPNGGTLYYSQAQTATVDCADGSPFTFTVDAHSFASLSQKMADRMALDYAEQQARLNRICISDLPSYLAANEPADLTLTALCTDPLELTWEVISGSIPHGMVFGTDESIGIAFLTGTPDTPGPFTFTVQAFREDGDYMSKTFTITIVDIDTSGLGQYTTGTPYIGVLAITGASPAQVIWSVTGTLPPGLTLNPNSGGITGTPTGTGDVPVIFNAELFF
jgi:hypothetical protein